MVDALVSNTNGFTVVRVRVPPPAHEKRSGIPERFFYFHIFAALWRSFLQTTARIPFFRKPTA